MDNPDVVTQVLTLLNSMALSIWGTIKAIRKLREK